MRGAEDEQSVLVVETLATRRSPAGAGAGRGEAEPGAPPRPAAGAGHRRAGGHPFDSERGRGALAREATEVEDTVDNLVEEGIGLLNRALHAQATASADPLLQELTPERAVAVRIGFGSGEEVAAGRGTSAREVDARAGGASRRRLRAEELRPQERVAAVLGGKEPIDPCETLLLRARADVDAGRGARRRCSCGSAWRRCSWSSTARSPTLGTSSDMASWPSAAARRAKPPTRLSAASWARSASSRSASCWRSASASSAAAESCAAAERAANQPSDRILSGGRGGDDLVAEAGGDVVGFVEGDALDRGDADHGQAAARAAATPVGESSRATTLGPASTPSRRQASR